MNPSTDTPLNSLARTWADRAVRAVRSSGMRRTDRALADALLQAGARSARRLGGNADSRVFVVVGRTGLPARVTLQPAGGASWRCSCARVCDDAA